MTLKERRIVRRLQNENSTSLPSKQRYLFAACLADICTTKPSAVGFSKHGRATTKSPGLIAGMSSNWKLSEVPEVQIQINTCSAMKSSSSD